MKRKAYCHACYLEKHGVKTRIAIAHTCARKDPEVDLWVELLKNQHNMKQKQFHPVHACYDGVFDSFLGTKISLQAPTADMISIVDIAHALSNICRFGGHASQFYSVAQHSCIVAYFAPEHLKMAGILHDAAEAYLGDVIKPLKVILGDSYKVLEDRFEMVIGNKFGVPMCDFKAIKKYDMMALEMEHEGLIKGNWQPMKELNPIHNIMEPEEAEEFFLFIFEDIQKAL